MTNFCERVLPMETVFALDRKGELYLEEKIPKNKLNKLNLFETSLINSNRSQHEESERNGNSK